ncbi:MAG: hypothetical protein EXS18_00315 [Verrucomicrobiae bacterium]|nr:hypothetical protein [Verrucomicrobiae bacterium]
MIYHAVKRISQPSHRNLKKAGTIFCLALPHGRGEKETQDRSRAFETNSAAADLQLRSRLSGFQVGSETGVEAHVRTFGAWSHVVFLVHLFMEEVGLDELAEDLWDSRWALPIPGSSGTGVFAGIGLKCYGTANQPHDHFRLSIRVNRPGNF